MGRIARDAVEQARAQVAKLVGAYPDQILFTSGGTEANNLAIRGLAGSLSPGTVLLSPIEHSSVIEPLNALAQKGWRIKMLKVNDQGEIDKASLTDSIDAGPRFACCLIANNETGVIQNIPAFAAPLRERNIPIHCDGVQALAKIPLDFESLGINFLSLSAHKIGGPKGAGALVIDKSLRLEGLLLGGGQEGGLRAGTQNVPAIVGFGAAAEIAGQKLLEQAQQIQLLKQKLELGLKKYPSVIIFSENAERLANTLMFGVPGMDGEMMVMELDRKGIAVSSGSACSSQSTEPSHVLLAMGVSEENARSAVRVSLGPENTDNEIERFLSAIDQIVSANRIPV